MSLNLNSQEEKIIRKYILRKSNEDHTRILEDIKDNEIQMVILKMHLYIEKELNEFIKEFFEKPDLLLNDMKLSFIAKLKILHALDDDIIDKPLYNAILKINNVRNSLAHTLNYEFTEDEFKKLHDTLEKDLKRGYKLEIEIETILKENLTHHDQGRTLLIGIWLALKTKVLMACIRKKVLAGKYELEYAKSIHEIIKNASESAE
ncbi:hypothetical protein ABES38_11700 [Bacillus gobiensis]|uniref:hypothetical protein n=1 Tax=Bacillus gobiensis TaxID=1441095 RepID=UPI003D19FCB4